MEALEARHTKDLTFAEVRRALQALSTLYVKRRDRVAEGEALGTAGKRAAFALFYGPLHFLAVRAVVQALGAGRPAPREILDLGCGTGVGGAAWALEAGSRCALRGRRPQRLGDRGGAVHPRAPGPAGRSAPRRRPAVDAAGQGRRHRVRVRRERAAGRCAGRAAGAAPGGGARRRARVLIVEPIARGLTPWWPRWADAFERAGGRSDEWRFPARLPARLALLDRAASLDHRELTARSLYCGATS